VFEITFQCFYQVGIPFAVVLVEGIYIGKVDVICLLFGRKMIEPVEEAKLLEGDDAFADTHRLGDTDSLLSFLVALADGITAVRILSIITPIISIAQTD
jgi:hypothetical protein